MLGVAAAVPTTTRQKILAFLLIAPTIYILNLLRNVFVIMAYTDQWFPYFPEIASNFNNLMGSVIQDGKLGTKEKELIALGIAVGLRCLPTQAERDTLHGL
jgi:archaeosortase A (PGF-CTERM-specific)